MTRLLFYFLLLLWSTSRSKCKMIGYSPKMMMDSDIPKGSVKDWDVIESPRKFSILSMIVDHHSVGPWYVKSFHEKGSSGWNRTMNKAFLNSPFACNIRFFGVGLESTLDGFQMGGTGYLAIGFEDADGKKYWHGFDRNETNRLHCYYTTNKDLGSEFLDKPKTLGIAIYCPITLDDEVGPFNSKATMQQGYYCRPLSDYPAEIEVHLRPSSFRNYMKGNPADEVVGEIHSNPASARHLEQKTAHAKRLNAVCTVQTFKNAMSGAMLFLFVAYYQLLGWRVIVYDRFGLHYEDLKDLLALPGVDYYPFTVYQLAQPSKYNDDFIAKQGTEFKSFYRMEINWGYASKKLADTADQDADKTRTYDFARMEYPHLQMLLYADADELFYCPQTDDTVAAQRAHQQSLMDGFYARGTEEMRFVRIPYSGMAPPGYTAPENRTTVDFTNSTTTCTIKAFETKNVLEMLKCWSTATSYDNFPKSADFASVCPFHYNHWSCDGMKGGGRDFTKNRCRCKVSFDMQNFFDYRPMLKKCHIMHFNDNKYWFQSRRTKHQYDHGSVTEHCPAVPMLERYYSDNHLKGGIPPSAD